jgi:type I restriction enzyme M protein
VEWKQQFKFIDDEKQKLGYDGRFGAGLPRINDGALLFLQHMISKMRTPANGGSRICIVFNGSPLFTGDAGSGESEIRRWIIEKDWLEAIIALPDQLFYNTGISTYLWVVTNRKDKQRKGKIQLVDAREFYVKMRKSLGNKRNMIAGEGDNHLNQIAEITKIYGNFKHNEKYKEVVVSKVFNNADFGYSKITVERPLRLNFQASLERIARLDGINAFKKIGESSKKTDSIRLKEMEEGKKRQEVIKKLLKDFSVFTHEKLFKDRFVFKEELEAFAGEPGINLSGSEVKAVLEALGEKDETAGICRDAKGNPEPDTDLRDTENVPLTEGIDDYFKREVLPHVPDAWIDKSKTKVGYEIPLNRHFYRYEAPRALEDIEADIKGLEKEILGLLGEVTGSGRG